MWNGYYEKVDLLFIKAVTNLHIGAGKSGEIVDLPVQRDSFGFPVIYSSSLKGAIKSYIYHRNGKEVAEILLGPDEAGDFTSSISLTDAYLLTFPARSLKGVYCYLTCPFLLKRFKEHLKIINKHQELQQIIDNVNEAIKDKKDKGISYGSKDLLIEGNNAIINEELMISIEENENILRLIEKLPKIDKELVVINDDDCLTQATRTLIRLTRVKLDRSTKTVKAGPWTEEYIPSKTLFFSTMFSKKIPKDIQEKMSKEGEKQKIIEEIWKSPSTFLKENLKVLVIGGHETIGSGLIELFWSDY